MIDYKKANETDRHIEKSNGSVVVQRLKYQGAFIGRNKQNLQSGEEINNLYNSSFGNDIIPEQQEFGVRDTASAGIGVQFSIQRNVQTRVQTQVAGMRVARSNIGPNGYQRFSKFDSQVHGQMLNAFRASHYQNEEYGQLISLRKKQDGAGEIATNYSGFDTQSILASQLTDKLKNNKKQQNNVLKISEMLQGSLLNLPKNQRPAKNLVVNGEIVSQSTQAGQLESISGYYPNQDFSDSLRYQQNIKERVLNTSQTKMRMNNKRDISILESVEFQNKKQQKVYNLLEKLKEPVPLEYPNRNIYMKKVQASLDSDDLGKKYRKKMIDDKISLASRRQIQVKNDTGGDEFILQPSFDMGQNSCWTTTKSIKGKVVLTKTIPEALPEILNTGQSSSKAISLNKFNYMQNQKQVGGKLNEISISNHHNYDQSIQNKINSQQKSPPRSLTQKMIVQTNNQVANQNSQEQLSLYQSIDQTRSNSHNKNQQHDIISKNDLTTNRAIQTKSQEAKGFQHPKQSYKTPFESQLGILQKAMWSRIKKLGNITDSPDPSFIIKRQPKSNNKIQNLLSQEQQKLANIQASQNQVELDYQSQSSINIEEKSVKNEEIKDVASEIESEENASDLTGKMKKYLLTYKFDKMIQFLDQLTQDSKKNNLIEKSINQAAMEIKFDISVEGLVKIKSQCQQLINRRIFKKREVYNRSNSPLVRPSSGASQHAQEGMCCAVAQRTKKFWDDQKYLNNQLDQIPNYPVVHHCEHGQTEDEIYHDCIALYKKFISFEKYLQKQLKRDLPKEELIGVIIERMNADRAAGVAELRVFKDKKQLADLLKDPIMEIIEPQHLYQREKEIALLGSPRQEDHLIQAQINPTIFETQNQQVMSGGSKEIIDKINSIYQNQQQQFQSSQKLKTQKEKSEFSTPNSEQTRDQLLATNLINLIGPNKSLGPNVDLLLKSKQNQNKPKVYYTVYQLIKDNILRDKAALDLEDNKSIIGQKLQNQIDKKEIQSIIQGYKLNLINKMRTNKIKQSINLEQIQQKYKKSEQLSEEAERNRQHFLMGLDEHLQSRFNDFVEFCDAVNQKEDKIRPRDEFKNDEEQERKKGLQILGELDAQHKFYHKAKYATAGANQV